MRLCTSDCKRISQPRRASENSVTTSFYICTLTRVQKRLRWKKWSLPDSIIKKFLNINSAMYAKKIERRKKSMKNKPYLDENNGLKIYWCMVLACVIVHQKDAEDVKGFRARKESTMYYMYTCSIRYHLPWGAALFLAWNV